jgi:hypothetical protein
MYIGGIVEEGLAHRIDRHIDQRAHPEAEQHALLDPGVHAPAARGRSVRLSGTHLAPVERFLEALEQAEMLLRVRLRLLVEQRFDVSLQHEPGSVLGL